MRKVGSVIVFEKLIKLFDNFINVENNVDGSIFDGITVIEVGKENKIKRIIHSDNGIFDGKALNLNETDIFSAQVNMKIFLMQGKKFHTTGDLMSKKCPGRGLK